jgi:hypothetical protein
LKKETACPLISFSTRMTELHATHSPSTEMATGELTEDERKTAKVLTAMMSSRMGPATRTYIVPEFMPVWNKMQAGWL